MDMLFGCGAICGVILLVVASNLILGPALTLAAVGFCCMMIALAGYEMRKTSND